MDITTNVVVPDSDSDGDGIPDYEDPNPNDGPLVDNDNDGILNQDDLDDDNDGMPDDYEQTNGFDPFDGSDADSDVDADGYSNFEEYHAGTDPHVNPLELAIVGKTKYFVNSTGDIGVRNYVNDDTYTGSVTLNDGTVFAVEGVYEIVGNMLILARISPSPSTKVFTYLGNDAGVLSFNVSIYSGAETQSLFYDTAEERDAAINKVNPAIIMYLLN